MPTNDSGRPELLTIEEVAAYLRVPVGTLRMWRHLGTGPAVAKVGRHLRYRRQDLDAWLRSQVGAREQR